MLLDDLDRTFDIESSVETEDVPGIALDRRPSAQPRTAKQQDAHPEAVLPADAPEELVAAAERLVAAGYRISRADGEADAGNETGAGEAGGDIEADQGGEDIPALSPRELQVLALLAEGAPNKVIARRLDISVHTAKFHVASIIAKLNAANRTDATATAIRQGLVGA
ncbi:MAG: response regulator transcription factor [Rhizobiaceae bacterium]